MANIFVVYTDDMFVHSAIGLYYRYITVKFINYITIKIINIYNTDTSQ